MSLYGLRTDENRLTALLAKTSKVRGRTVTKVRLARSKGIRFMPMKARLNLRDPMSVNFVQPVPERPGGPIEIDVTDNNRGARSVMTRSRNGWKRSRVFSGGSILTSWLSPAIRAADGSLFFSRSEFSYTEGYLGRTEAHAELIVSKIKGGELSTVGGGPVSNGTGLAQGGIYPVSGRIWTVWQENDSEGIAFGGLFRTKVFAARVDLDGTGFDKEIPLWEGRTYFPGSTQAIEYQGSPVFLYDRQFSPGGGLHPTVDFSHGTTPPPDPG
ncbi:MAG: hypothetical protein M3Y45_00555 [Actinomycetota bacterium]|nr:hypothetical protein [Actinomycetota bacterium]